MNVLEKYHRVVRETRSILCSGRITSVRGDLLKSLGPQVHLGELCRIGGEKASRDQSDDQIGPDDQAGPAGSGGFRPGAQYAEVIGLKDREVSLMAYDHLKEPEVGETVQGLGQRLSVTLSPRVLGRILDPMGLPLDGKPLVRGESVSVFREPPSAMNRPPIREKLTTGIKCLDSFLPLGRGQRMGIFAGSGVGKSTLLGMLAQNVRADVIVLALIGERGREVREFIENTLGEEGLKRSVLVVSTADKPPLARVRGAFTAMTVAEYFRDRGKDVLLLFDSLTRLAMAQRELGLSLGEPPTTRGYTPSVFSLLPKFIERSGRTDRGSITALYNILVEGDDFDEPVSDAVRGLLDGHINLSRALARKNHYPAVDILDSVSRLDIKIQSPEENRQAGELRKMLALFKEKEDLINVGAYSAGDNPDLDRAVATAPELDEFLRQNVGEKLTEEEISEKFFSLGQTSEE